MPSKEIRLTSFDILMAVIAVFSLILSLGGETLRKRIIKNLSFLGILGGVFLLAIGVNYGINAVALALSSPFVPVPSFPFKFIDAGIVTALIGFEVHLRNRKKGSRLELGDKFVETDP